MLALTLLKASGSLVWAAADVLNVRFSELPEMQGLGDSAFTLGLFFASVGAACFVGKPFFALHYIAHLTIAHGKPVLLVSLSQVPLSSTGSHLQSEPHNPEAAAPRLSPQLHSAGQLTSSAHAGRPICCSAPPCASCFWSQDI